MIAQAGQPATDRIVRWWGEPAPLLWKEVRAILDAVQRAAIDVTADHLRLRGELAGRPRWFRRMGEMRVGRVEMPDSCMTAIEVAFPTFAEVDWPFVWSPSLFEDWLPSRWPGRRDSAFTLLAEAVRRATLDDPPLDEASNERAIVARLARTVARPGSAIGLEPAGRCDPLAVATPALAAALSATPSPTRTH